MIINELKGSYSNIYTEWIKENSNPNSPNSAYNAGDLLTKKYVDAPSQAKTRANTAENMYNIMIMEESNNNPVIIEDNIIKVLTTE